MVPPVTVRLTDPFDLPQVELVANATADNAADGWVIVTLAVAVHRFLSVTVTI